MPELPEVETVRRELEEKLAAGGDTGRRIKKVLIHQPKTLRDTSVGKFVEAVEGACIKKIGRRAKLLIIQLSSDYTMLIHLKMTGQLVYVPANAGRGKHERVVFVMGDRQELRFNDMRRFGYIKLVPTVEVDRAVEIAALGPEPLEPGFDLNAFRMMIRFKRQGKIKSLLMDQHFIAGIGNLYADEICFYAGVLPSRQVNTLTDAEIKRLHKGIQTILPAAIKHRGTSFRDYVSASGERGGHVPYLRVYRRTGQACLNCGQPVERIKLGGRGTHYCPKCQK